MVASSSAERRARTPFRFRHLALVGAIIVSCLFGTRVSAQHEHDGQPQPQTGSDIWVWNVDASVFFGFNYQYRKFTDFSAWESQNWLMGQGVRRIRSGTLLLSTMLSLEPWTMPDIGSPQAFQTGETFRTAPLIDYQHPHDLFMELSAAYRGTWNHGTWNLYGALVGEPAFGPPVFMHRASASYNPQAPLSHHYVDSTHITPGVVTAGAGAGSWYVGASAFRGREPDENRTDLDLGPLDSYSLRVGWTRGLWSAQVSGARLTLPEATTPYNAKRLSASVSYTQPEGRRLAWTAAFGQKREIHGNLEAYLVEGQMEVAPSHIVFMRGESVAKDILDAGFHPRGVFHRHRQSQVGALTVGYVRNLMTMLDGRFGIGADVTGYLVPDNLQPAYGSPSSFHVFLRFRGGRSSNGAPHVH